MTYYQKLSAMSDLELFRECMAAIRLSRETGPHRSAKKDPSTPAWEECMMRGKTDLYNRALEAIKKEIAERDRQNKETIRKL